MVFNSNSQVFFNSARATYEQVTRSSYQFAITRRARFFVIIYLSLRTLSLKMYSVFYIAAKNIVMKLYMLLSLSESPSPLMSDLIIYLPCHDYFGHSYNALMVNLRKKFYWDFKTFDCHSLPLQSMH